MSRRNVQVDNPHTRAVARFAAELRPEDIPSDVKSHAKWDILDTVGCAIYGQGLPIATILRRTFAEQAMLEGGASLWGRDTKASVETAALINGTLVHSFELDDLHHTAILHPGGVTLPAILALAETRGTRGVDLLTAHVAGLEVSSRVGLAVGVPLLRRGWHNNGVLGVFGSAAGSANLLRLNADQSMHAIGIAGSLAAGLMAAQFGAMVKRMHAGQAAQNGLRAARLAEQGFTGIETLFEEEYGGFFTTYADSHEIDEVSADFGTRWETLNVGFKRFSCCGSNHSTVDVLLGLRNSHDMRPEDIERIDIRCSSATADHVGWPYAPNSVMTAQMNLPYAAAVAVLEGAAFVNQYAEDRLRDPAILEMARRVHVTADPEIDARGKTHRHEVHVEVHLKDGNPLAGSALHAKGSAHVPLDEHDMISKFMGLVSPSLGEVGAERLKAAVMSLDTSDDLAPLTEALHGAGDLRNAALEEDRTNDR